MDRSIVDITRKHLASDRARAAGQ